MDAPIKFGQLLESYQLKIEKELRSQVNLLGEKTPLRDACEYALLNGGKRFRPALVFMTANALGNELDVTESALAIEFFHTASLIADDLPCMDNDDFRREAPALHKAFGETTALLASYALISAGYAAIAKNAEKIRQTETTLAVHADRMCVLALECATLNTGILGATGGQFLDIFPPDLNYDTLCEAIHKKTSALFEISFLFGWVFGGGAIEKIDLIKALSAHFGMAFQIADDFGDIEQDAANERKVNIPAVLGKDKARELFNQEIKGYLDTLKQLQINSEELALLAKLLQAKVL